MKHSSHKEEHRGFSKAISFEIVRLTAEEVWGDNQYKYFDKNHKKISWISGFIVNIQGIFFHSTFITKIEHIGEL